MGKLDELKRLKENLLLKRDAESGLIDLGPSLLVQLFDREEARKN